jgi:hypothetical protein
MEPTVVPTSSRSRKRTAAGPACETPMSGLRYDAAWRRGSFQFGLTKWHVYPFG